MEEGQAILVQKATITEITFIVDVARGSEAVRERRSFLIPESQIPRGVSITAAIMARLSETVVSRGDKRNYFRTTDIRI